MREWLFLAAAILFEVGATTALKTSDGFSRLLPTALSLVGYAVAFYCLSQALRTIPLGLAYAIWCGAGILLLVAIGWFIFQQSLRVPEVIGIILILAGITVLRWSYNGET